MTRSLFLQITLAVSLVALTLPVKAMPAGDSGATVDTEKKTSPKALKCKRGETVKRVKKNGKFKNICVKLKMGVLSDVELYQAARTLADEHEYEWSLDHLRLISQQQDPEVLNYTGYAHRKAGRLETGISYYKQSLALEPDYVQAREYLGEALVLAGFNHEAAEQLDAIKQICGTGCEAYTTLSRYMSLQQP